MEEFLEKAEPDFEFEIRFRDSTFLQNTEMHHSRSDPNALFGLHCPCSYRCVAID